MGIEKAVQGFTLPLHSLVIRLVSFNLLITLLITSVHDLLSSIGVSLCLALSSAMGIELPVGNTLPSTGTSMLIA